MFYFSDFCTAASINMEGQEHLDIPLVVIFFPGNRKKHHDDHLIESTDCNVIVFLCLLIYAPILVAVIVFYAQIGQFCRFL